MNFSRVFWDIYGLIRMSSHRFLREGLDVSCLPFERIPGYYTKILCQRRITELHTDGIWETTIPTENFYLEPEFRCCESELRSRRLKGRWSIKKQANIASQVEFFERDIIDQNVTKTSRKIFFSPIDYPTHYDSVFLPDSFKNKFIQRFEGFDKEVLSKFPKVHNHVLEDIMRKLKTVYDRSITKQFNFEEMAKCKSVTDKLDLLRDEKFKHVFGFNSTEFVTNQTKVI